MFCGNRLRPPIIFSEFLAGCRDEAPLLLGVAPFGMLYSISALAVGMPAWLVQLASAVVFAGSAQLAIVQMLSVAAGALPIGLTAGLLNLRHVLYSASVADYISHLPRRWRLLLAYLLTDEAYAVAILRYRRNAAAARTRVKKSESDALSRPDLNHWYFFGCGFSLWACWQLSTAAGLLFGARIPLEWDLDFAVPLTFLALLTLLLRERPSQVASLAAGLGVLAFAALPYKLGLVTGVLLGLVAGALTAKHWSAPR